VVGLAWIVAAEACVTRISASRPTIMALRTDTSWTGTGARLARTPLVSLGARTVANASRAGSWRLTNR